MKKIIVIMLAAVCCLTSCIFNTNVTDCIYEVRVGVDGKSHESVFSLTGSGKLILEYKNAFNEHLNKDSGHQWVVTINNNSFTPADSDAKSLFQKYCEAETKFNDEWKARFKACSDDQSSYSHEYSVVLSRFVEGKDVELARKDYSIHFND